jgi:hypothetical protein
MRIKKEIANTVPVPAPATVCKIGNKASMRSVPEWQRFSNIYRLRRGTGTDKVGNQLICDDFPVPGWIRPTWRTDNGSKFRDPVFQDQDPQSLGDKI